MPFEFLWGSKKLGKKVEFVNFAIYIFEVVSIELDEWQNLILVVLDEVSYCSMLVIFVGTFSAFFCNK